MCVTLYSSKNKKPVAVTETFGSQLSDETYSFDLIKPGSYTVEFKDCDGDPKPNFDKVFLGGVKNIKDATFVMIVPAGDRLNNDITPTLRKEQLFCGGPGFGRAHRRIRPQFVILCAELASRRPLRQTSLS